MKNIKELSIIELDKIAGGNDPDPSQFYVLPWNEVVERLKGYVWYFKNLNATYERALQFINHTIDESVIYKYTWHQDEDAIRNFSEWRSRSRRNPVSVMTPIVQKPTVEPTFITISSATCRPEPKMFSITISGRKM